MLWAMIASVLSDHSDDRRLSGEADQKFQLMPPGLQIDGGPPRISNFRQHRDRADATPDAASEHCRGLGAPHVRKRIAGDKRPHGIDGTVEKSFGATFKTPEIAQRAARGE